MIAYKITYTYRLPEKKIQKRQEREKRDPNQGDKKKKMGLAKKKKPETLGAACIQSGIESL